MVTPLDILISYYEEEKTSLLQLIAQYQKDEEYQFAYFHSRALRQVNAKLRTLLSLRDRGYGEKKWKQDVIQRLEEQLQSPHSPYMQDFLIKVHLNI